MNYIGLMEKQIVESGSLDMRLKNLFKYIFLPWYRRSCQIADYLRQGYTAQGALAKAKVIEV